MARVQEGGCRIVVPGAALQLPVPIINASFESSCSPTQAYCRPIAHLNPFVQRHAQNIHCRQARAKVEWLSLSV